MASTTAKLHADTFGIMESTAHPDEAFEVLTYLLNNDTLIARYGALPAVKSKQAAFFDALDERFAPQRDRLAGRARHARATPTCPAMKPTCRTS